MRCYICDYSETGTLHSPPSSFHTKGLDKSVKVVYDKESDTFVCEVCLQEAYEAAMEMREEEEDIWNKED